MANNSYGGEYTPTVTMYPGITTCLRCLQRFESLCVRKLRYCKACREWRNRECSDATIEGGVFRIGEKGHYRRGEGPIR